MGCAPSLLDSNSPEPSGSLTLTDLKVLEFDRPIRVVLKDGDIIKGDLINTATYGCYDFLIITVNNDGSVITTNLPVHMIKTYLQ